MKCKVLHTFNPSIYTYHIIFVAAVNRHIITTLLIFVYYVTTMSIRQKTKISLRCEKNRGV